MALDSAYLTLLALGSVAAGLVGSFALMKRMSLAADAISHIALPGIGIALLVNWNPLIGGGAALLLGSLAIWGLENQTRISTETVIGIIFSAALALGSILTPGEEIIEALFGGTRGLSAGEFLFGAVAALAAIVFIISRKDALILSLVSRDIAETSGVRVRLLNLLFLLIFSLTVILGLRYLGVLLMGSLLIIPAATAKYVTRSLTGMLVTSAIIALVSALGGALIADAFFIQTGPAIILVAASCFLASLGFRSLRGR